MVVEIKASDKSISNLEGLEALETNLPTIEFFYNKLQNAYCSCLNIYISQKIRLCVVDLEGQFQTTLPAKAINFLTWKFRSIILIFLLFFAGFPVLFAYCWCYSKELKYLNCNLMQKCDSNESNRLGIASTVCKELWIWQLLQKTEGKWEWYIWIFRLKKW